MLETSENLVSALHGMFQSRSLFCRLTRKLLISALELTVFVSERLSDSVPDLSFCWEDMFAFKKDW